MKVVYKKDFDKAVDTEVDSLHDLASAMSSGDTYSDVDLTHDAVVATTKAKSLKTAKGMFDKLSVDTDVDKVMLLDMSERKLFFKIVKVVFKTRKFFRNIKNGYKP